MITLPHLFLDCDGVLADFNIHVQNLFGFSPREVSDEKLWEHIHARDDFWLTIPIHKGAQNLIDYALQHNPTILTACPKDNFDKVSEDKKVWIKERFGDIPVITCIGKEKQLYMKNKGDILVDDFIANIKRWEQAGGKCVYYTVPHKGLWRLKKTYEELNNTGIENALV